MEIINFYQFYILLILTYIKIIDYFDIFSLGKTQKGHFEIKFSNLLRKPELIVLLKNSRNSTKNSNNSTNK